MRRFACLALFIPAVAFPATVDVTVGPGLSFNPPTVTVASGDTVRWVWAGAVHTSTSDTNSGPEVWDSGFLFSGTFSHTFNTTGDWPYYCAVHSFPGGTAMNGVVHVLAAMPTVSSINPASGPSAGGTAVTISGTNLSGATSVTFGATAATITANTASSISVTTPPHAAGTVDVVVNTASGSATLTGGYTFTACAAACASGDANGDGQVTAADVFYMINNLFTAGPAPIGSADANGDGQVTVADIFYLINYLFAAGPAPH